MVETSQNECVVWRFVPVELFSGADPRQLGARSCITDLVYLLQSEVRQCLEPGPSVPSNDSELNRPFPNRVSLDLTHYHQSEPQHLGQHLTGNVEQRDHAPIMR